MKTTSTDGIYVVNTERVQRYKNGEISKYE